MSSETQESQKILDLIVVGGGINGAGIAADAAGRGLTVGLYDAEDLASDTFSASSNLIYNRLCHLEPYEFRLATEAIAEREAILKNAPHIVKPMRFCLPDQPFLRSAWMIRMGFFLYDHLGKNTTLAPSQQVNLSKSGLLKKALSKGFEYSDCWVDDTRLVLLNALSAKANGAEVKNYCRVVEAERAGNLWIITLLNTQTHLRFQRKARALINTTGSWGKLFLDDSLADENQMESNEDWLYVKQFFDSSVTAEPTRDTGLVTGLHLVVPRIHNEAQAYLLPSKDNRVIFVIPYLHDFSLIGTTDIDNVANPLQANAFSDETDYLLDVVNQYFIKQLTAEDVVWTYRAAHPKSGGPQTTTRDYTLTLEQQHNQAPLLSVLGGNLTTYRKLSESAMQLLKPFFGRLGDSWTADVALPGGDFNYPPQQLAENLVAQYGWLPLKTATRYVSQFGTRAWQLFDGYESEADFSTHFGSGLYRREIDYYINNEFAKTAEDILWRRTKLGLYLSKEQQANVAAYIQNYRNIGIAKVS